MRAIWFRITADHEPLGVTSLAPSNPSCRSRAKHPGPVKYTYYLRSCDVLYVMHAVMVKTCPAEPHHFMRLHLVFAIDCHATWVTAAPALHLAGKSFEIIAFKICWSVESVKHYIRDSNRDIGRATAAAVIQGHFLLQIPLVLLLSPVIYTHSFLIVLCLFPKLFHTPR